eukprot:8875788-Lingulodinium_polyedra.AAC.1
MQTIIENEIIRNCKSTEGLRSPNRRRVCAWSWNNPWPCNPTKYWKTAGKRRGSTIRTLATTRTALS